MPGRYFLTTHLPDIAARFQAGVAAGVAAPARLNIAPGQTVLVCSPQRQIVSMRWGIIPVGRVNARGRPVMETIINARSETVFARSAFEGVGRCLVPADGWYEWTGKACQKTAWRLRPRSGEIMAFAGIFDIWSGPGGVSVAQVATVTCEPNADVSPIHHRMGGLVAPGDYETWLGRDETSAAALMRPLPDGQLIVEPAEDVDWRGA